MAYLQEAFEVRDGVIVWRERPRQHFPERPEDHGNWNTRFAGLPAGFLINGETFVRVQ